MGVALVKTVLTLLILCNICLGIYAACRISRKTRRCFEEDNPSPNLLQRMGAPEWVSKELLENALKEFFNNKDIQILGYTSSAAVPAGDNYTSDLFRTSITYNTGQNGNRSTVSVIIKCSPETREQMRQLVAEIRMFEIEAEMYMKTLPALHKIIGETCSLSARFIYFTKVPHRIIMFEDLTPLGFRMYNRQQGFDLQHCLMVIDKMACQHAASVVLHEKVSCISIRKTATVTSALYDPVLIAGYQAGLYSSNSMIADWVMTGWDALTQATARWAGYEKYSYKLKALRDKVITKTVATIERKLGAFHVLNHGDAWVNNFLFSYTSDGKLKDFRFVDYQMVVYSSPAIDLHYFWATSPKIEVRKEHLDTILDRYYAQLLHNLSKFQYSLERVPTKSQFLKDFESKAFYGLVAAATVLPLVKASSRQDASFEHLMDDTENEDGFRYHAYNNERYRKHIEYLLSFFDKLGALDSY